MKGDFSQPTVRTQAVEFCIAGIGNALIARSIQGLIIKPKARIERLGMAYSSATR